MKITRYIRIKVPVYALPHKKEKMEGLARMMGYSVSALLNKAFDDLYENKKEELKKWLQDNSTD